jgi:hypothetical protein
MKLKHILRISVFTAGMIIPFSTYEKPLPTYEPLQPKPIPLKTIPEQKQIKEKQPKEIYWDAIKSTLDNYC